MLFSEGFGVPLSLKKSWASHCVVGSVGKSGKTWHASWILCEEASRFTYTDLLCLQIGAKDIHQIIVIERTHIFPAVPQTFLGTHTLTTSQARFSVFPCSDSLNLYSHSVNWAPSCPCVFKWRLNWVVMYIPQDLPTNVAEQGFKPVRRHVVLVLWHCTVCSGERRTTGAGLLHSGNARSPVKLEVQINKK